MFALVIHGAHQNGNGLILGVNDLQNNLMLQPSDLLPQNLHGTIGFATDIKASPNGQDPQVCFAFTYTGLTQ